MGGHVARMVDMGNAYNIFLGKTDGKKPLGRCRHVDRRIILKVTSIKNEMIV
jgi:hypothetical protein